MPETTESTETKNSPLSQLASFGDDLLGKATKNPAAAKFLQNANQLKERVDDLSKRVRGLDALEQRVGELEQRIEKLEKPGRKPATPSSKPE
ncbi:MAG TPA: hypothetical protein VH538_06020 [Gaiellaceae bacterium]|jgi:polyhydroxyalkanoate synthesis regulator phasin